MECFELPIYKKSQEIFDCLETITGLFPEDNEYLQNIKGNLIGDIMMIQAKICGAEAVKLYDIKMENAAIIRKAAREIFVGGNTLEYFGFSDSKYYFLVRKLIEEFRLLFIDWISNFNPKHYIVDNWGLFNPAGISHDHIQTDEDLDFLDEDDDEIIIIWAAFPPTTPAIFCYKLSVQQKPPYPQKMSYVQVGLQIWC